MLQKRQNLPRDSTQLDIDPRTPEGRTPLHIAAAKCHHGLLRLLLEHCSNVNARDDWGRTPLHFAAAGSPGESEELVKLLLSRNADFDLPDNDGWTALTYAAQAGNERVVRRLLDKGSNPNATNGAINTPLDMAVLSNSEQIVEWLLKRGADP
ncbi:ankyrin, partial [Hypoxylon sp. EC38]